MNITSYNNNGSHILKLSGDFTFSDHMEFRDILMLISDASTHSVTFNFAQVHFVDSAALGMLLLARDEAEKHRKKIVLSQAAGQVKKMFSVARFNELFALE